MDLFPSRPPFLLLPDISTVCRVGYRLFVLESVICPKNGLGCHSYQNVVWLGFDLLHKECRYLATGHWIAQHKSVAKIIEVNIDYFYAIGNWFYIEISAMWIFGVLEHSMAFYFLLGFGQSDSLSMVGSYLFLIATTSPHLFTNLLNIKLTFKLKLNPKIGAVKLVGFFAHRFLVWEIFTIWVK